MNKELLYSKLSPLGKYSHLSKLLNLELSQVLILTPDLNLKIILEGVQEEGGNLAEELLRLLETTTETEKLISLAVETQNAYNAIPARTRTSRTGG